MKKYVKPDLYYENFELSTHVATCAVHFNLNAANTNDCSGFLDGAPGVTIFSNPESCMLKPGDIYCYTNGTEDKMLFNS